jgi:fluoride ion exporter CrcB/FEX
LLTLGALGGYTTYSTFALARLELLADNGRVGAALLNTMGQLVAGLALAYIGVLVVRGLQGMGGTV